MPIMKNFDWLEKKILAINTMALGTTYMTLAVSHPYQNEDEMSLRYSCKLN